MHRLRGVRRKCPKKVDNEYNEGLDKRKAIYVKYAQAVPLKYAIDEDNCIYFMKGQVQGLRKILSGRRHQFRGPAQGPGDQGGRADPGPGFQGL